MDYEKLIAWAKENAGCRVAILSPIDENEITGYGTITAYSLRSGRPYISYDDTPEAAPHTNRVVVIEGKPREGSYSFPENLRVIARGSGRNMRVTQGLETLDRVEHAVKTGVLDKLSRML